MQKEKIFLLNIIFVLLCSFVFTSCKNTDAYVIRGDIKGIKSPYIYIVTRSDSITRIDTIRLKSNRFKFKGESETLKPVVIYMEKGNVWMTAWAKNGNDIALTGDVNYPELILAKGGEVNDLLSEFKITNKTLLRERCDLRDKVLSFSKENNNTGSEITNAQLSAQMKNINQSLINRSMEFIKRNPSSIASLVLIQDFLLDMENAAEIQSVLCLITGEAKESELFKKIQAWSIKDQQAEVGNTAPNFCLVSTKKDTIRLETFKNKYLLLTFSASWSRFGESDYPKWIDIRKNFPENELGMLTISLDENKADWEKIVKNKGFTWTQVIDNLGWSSPVVSLYNVSEIPSNYLINKDKIIIGSKISIDSIQSILMDKLPPPQTMK